MMLSLFETFVSLDLLLFHFFAPVIPMPEWLMATIGLGGLSLLLRNYYPFIQFAFELDSIYTHKPAKATFHLHKTPFFTRSFIALSSCEVFFTILAPWAILLWLRTTGRDKGVETQDLHLLVQHLVSHLFAFQAQIAWEAFLFQGRDMEMFLYTIAANAYRGYILFHSWPTTTSFMASATTAVGAIDVALWSVTALLWCFSSFIFTPLIWYPCLQHTTWEATTPGIHRTQYQKAVVNLQ